MGFVGSVGAVCRFTKGAFSDPLFNEKQRDLDLWEWFPYIVVSLRILAVVCNFCYGGVRSLAYLRRIGLSRKTKEGFGMMGPCGYLGGFMRNAVVRQRWYALLSVVLFGMLLFGGQWACNCGGDPGVDGGEETSTNGEKVVESICPKPSDPCENNATCQACGSLLTCVKGVCVDTGEPFDLDTIPFCPSLGSICIGNSDCQKPNCSPLECRNGICADVIPDVVPDEERCPLTCSSGADCAVKACGERIACLNGVCGPPQQKCPDTCSSDEQCRTPDCGERVRCVAGKCGTIQKCPEKCASDAECQQATCGTKIACKEGVCSEPDSNTPPTAVIDPIRDAPQVGNRITMDGRNSKDADGDTLTFRWRITKRPQGSQASFDNSASSTPAFIPDFAGIYTIELIVNDGKVDSKPATVDLDIKNSALPPPVLNALAPNEATTDQLPLNVSLFGANFRPDSKVTVDGAGQSVTFVNRAELSIKASGLSVGTHKIQVENADGQKSAILDFVVKAKVAQAPRIDALDPSQIESGTPILFKILGEFFVSGATATLAGNVFSVTFNSSKELSGLTAVALMVGTYDVQVTNPDGQKSNIVKLTIAPQKPVLKLTSLSPTEIFAGVKTALKVTGDAFVAGAVLVIGGQRFAATSVTQMNMEVDVLLATAGTYTVVVQNPDGSTTNPLQLIVKNAAPKLSFVDPAQVQEFTPITLRLNGTGFLSGAQGRLNGTAYPTTFVSTTELRVTLPDTVKAGTYSVDVLNPDSQASNTVTLTVTPKPPAPKIVTIVPARVEQGAGTEITVNGSDFVSGAQIQIGPRLLNATFDNANTLRVKVPTDLVAGNYPVVVFNPDGQKSNTGTIEIFRSPPPVLNSIDPTSAEVGKALTIEFKGSNFRSGSATVFQGAAQTTAFVDAQTLRMTISLNGVSAGTYEVWVENPDGQISQKLKFTVTAPQGPQIVQLLPKDGTTNTKVNGIVDGRGFVTGAKVLFNGQAMTTTFINASSLGVVYDLNNIAAGTYPVVVENPDGKRSNAAFFTVSGQKLPAPILISVTPTTIKLSSNQPIYLNGQHFQSGAVMSLQLPFVGAVGLPTNYINDTLLIVTAQLPSIPFPFPPQRVQVYITNPDGQKSNSLQVTVER